MWLDVLIVSPIILLQQIVLSGSHWLTHPNEFSGVKNDGEPGSLKHIYHSLIRSGGGL